MLLDRFPGKKDGSEWAGVPRSLYYGMDRHSIPEKAEHSGYIYYSKSGPRPPGRIGSVKAEPTSCLERPPAGIRALLSDLGKIEIPPPAHKTFDSEGGILKHALTKSLRIRNEAIKSLCSSVRRFRDATVKEECKSDYPHALQALWKALDRGGRFDSGFLWPIGLTCNFTDPSVKMTVNIALLYRLNSTYIRSRAVSNLSLLLQLSVRISVIASPVALLIISTLVAYGQSQPPGFKELQIRAIITKDTTGLNAWTVRSQTEKFAVEWTSMAAQIIKENHGLMAEDGAAVLSDFIYKGASHYVDEGAPAARADEAQRNLRSFVSTLIGNDKASQPIDAQWIGKSYVEKIQHTLCPIWPFCS